MGDNWSLSFVVCSESDLGLEDDEPLDIALHLWLILACIAWCRRVMRWCSLSRGNHVIDGEFGLITCEERIL